MLVCRGSYPVPMRQLTHHSGHPYPDYEELKRDAPGVGLRYSKRTPIEKGRGGGLNNICPASRKAEICSHIRVLEISVADPDSHHCRKPDPHQSKKQDSNPR
jgi:hypothetical protein